MNLPSPEIINLLTYLLPGFITAAVLYYLTASPRPAPFERTVEALIFTGIIQVLVPVVRRVLVFSGHHIIVVGVWSETIRLIWSFILALALGLLLAWWANRDVLFTLLRRFGITLKTSYPSEWYAAFSRNRGYVVLHLVGERRIYGWAAEWSDMPDSGHIKLIWAQWLVEGNKPIPITGVDAVLIKSSDVERVEFMTPLPEGKEAEHGRAQSTNPSTTAT